MGRPISKMNEEAIRFVVDNSGKMSFIGMARKLKVHHTTILYWRRKLAQRGIHIESHVVGEADKLLDKLYGKFVSGKKPLSMDSGVRAKNE